MKKFTVIFVFLLSAKLLAQSSNINLDPRVKSVGSMALYGTLGGALLGTASLAFGANGRWVAKGASLGLYSGIAFGSYVVASHAINRRSRMDGEGVYDNYYQNQENNVLPPREPAGGGVGGSNLPLFPNYRHKNNGVLFFLPILNLEF